MRKKVVVRVVCVLILLVMLFVLTGCVGCDGSSKDCNQLKNVANSCEKASENTLITSYDEPFLCITTGHTSCLESGPKGPKSCSSEKVGEIINQFVSGSDANKILNAWFFGVNLEVNEEIPDEERDQETERIENLNTAVQAARESRRGGSGNVVDVDSIFDVSGYSGIFFAECNAGTVGIFFAAHPNEQISPGEDVELYGCVNKNGAYQWLEKSDLLSERYDQDQDKVPYWFDCNDLDEDVYGDFTIYGGDDPRIICGDQKQNTCGIVEQETDDCSADQGACRFNCLEEGGKCSWLDSDNGNNCCGDEEEDLATPTLGSLDGVRSNYLCLSDQKELVGYDGDSSADIPGWEQERCAGNWCWLDAKSESRFDIFSIKSPGETFSYDIFSDSSSWNECAIEGPVGIKEELPLEYKQARNRFYCYREGVHFSYAECGRRDGIENVGSKSRYAGDGVYALYLEGEENELGGSTRTGQQVDILPDETYKNYYENENGETFFDFQGYDQLEFFVTFQGDKLHQPAELFLRIFGPLRSGGLIPYFNENVLGYAVSGADLKIDNKLHMRVPIPNNLQDVSKIQFATSPANNIIEVENVYLTRAGENSAICSGKDGGSRSSWLSSFDEGDSRQEFTAAEMCRQHYGLNAWLGNTDEVDDPSASCCGNNQEPEYYASKARTQDGKNYGCWNSQPIGDKDTVAQVEFEVEYEKKTINPVFHEGISVPPPTVSWDLEIAPDEEARSFKVCEGFAEPREEQDTFGVCDVRMVATDQGGGKHTMFVPRPTYINNFYIEFRKDFLGKVEFYFEDELVYTEENYRSSTYVGFGPPVLISKVVVTVDEEGGYVSDVHKRKGDNGALLDANAPNGFFFMNLGLIEGQSPDINDNIPFNIIRQESPLSISELGQTQEIYPFNRRTFQFNYVFRAYSNTPGVYVYFQDAFDPSNKQNIIEASDLPARGWPIQAEITGGVEITETKTRETEKITNSCLGGEECTFPLPGSPGNEGYKLTNLHPGLYDLYFIDEEGNEHLVTETKQLFPSSGTVKVSNVPRQVVLVNIETEQKFYGCQAASPTTEEVPGLIFENLGNCEVKANHFCSFNDDGLINSWSNQPLTSVGYIAQEPIPENVNDLILELREPEEKDLTPRNYPSPAVPGRNILPNADFSNLDTNDILNWKIIPGGEFLNERQYVNDKFNRETEIFTLEEGDIIFSDKISVPINSRLRLSNANECRQKISIFDNEGLPEQELINENSFTTGETTSFLRLEFSGPCQLKNLMLQIVDELGPQTYTTFNIDQPQRAGAACCPTREDGQGYCWNGYSCIEPMGESTILMERVGEERTYRCIDGNWEHLPVKFAWNFDQTNWGFCQDQSQCFVMKSPLGNVENSAETFTEGSYPLCVNNGEFILDNYCDNGKWSSRTKFLAAEMLNVIEDTDNYAIYCTDQEGALVELGEGKEFVAGTFLSVGEASFPGEEPEQMQVCFDKQNDENWNKLVPAEDNKCINNVCVMKYTESNLFGFGETQKVAFATTLNKPIDASDSFLGALGIQSNPCPVGEGFVNCPIENSNKKLWYSDNLKAIVYGNIEVVQDRNIFQKFLELLGNLFGGESQLSSEREFIEEAQSFREVYLLKSGDEKAIRAMKEIQEHEIGTKQRLVAEYENFDTSVCDYVDHIKYPGLKPIGTNPVSCTKTEDIQRVEAVQALDFFWPQLTGSLRVS